MDVRIEELNILTHLRETEMFNVFVLALDRLAGLSLKLIPSSQWPPKDSPAGCMNPICAKKIASGWKCVTCKDFDSATRKSPETLECLGHLRQTAVPVRYGARILGYLYFGPFLVERRKSKRKEKGSPIAAISDEVLQITIKLLKIVADDLERLANQGIILSRKAPPGIEVAAVFVESNYAKPISLDQVTKRAGMSRTHFCRTFKKAKGLGFTEFVNRVRVEKAKARLSDLNFRVTEVAADVGFHSLTQFNRAFKRIVGINPSAYRDSLKGKPEGIPGKAVSQSVKKKAR